MQHGDALEQRFEKRFRSRQISCAPEINDKGLVFGAGTILAPMTRDAYGAPILALEKDGDRILALLSAAYHQPVPRDLLRHVEGASSYWRRGEKALANIRLAFASLPPLDERVDAYRLFLAEELLDDGMSPTALMKALGFDEPDAGLAKYDPNQPRVPAGNGSASGQWTSGAIAAASTAPAIRAPVSLAALAARAARAAGTLAEGLFAPVANSQFLEGLATIARGVGAGIVLGAIFIPNRNRSVSAGVIPGAPDLSYSLDHPAGVLRLFREVEGGREALTEAHLGRNGIFYEKETGFPLARFVGGSLVFDAAALDDEAEETRAGERADALARAKRRVELCPAPSKDVPHGASERAIAYQAQISAWNNPDGPLPPGMAVSLINPKTNRRVVFDDCRESDGTMIEAKGPGYAQLLKSEYLVERIVKTRWRSQAERQISAANGQHKIDWFFAEPEAAEKAREFFESTEPLDKINVIYVPAVMQ